MPYTLVLTLKGGRVVANFQIFNVPTPKRGDTIDLERDGRAIKARVTAIGRSPSREPGAQAFDIVSAQET